MDRRIHSHRQLKGSEESAIRGIFNLSAVATIFAAVYRPLHAQLKPSVHSDGKIILPSTSTIRPQLRYIYLHQTSSSNACPSTEDKSFRPLPSPAPLLETIRVVGTVSAQAIGLAQNIVQAHHCRKQLACAKFAGLAGFVRASL